MEVNEITVMEKGITFVLPVYCEEENLRTLFPQWKEALDSLDESYEILVVDTARPLDNTKAICEQYGARYVNQENPGLGGAFKTAIKYACYDKFLISDADGSHAPHHIPEIYAKFMRDNADIVIGSRYMKGGKTNDSFLSIIMSRILNTVFGVVIGIKAKELSTNFRLYYTEQLKQVEETNPIKRPNYDFQQEILLKLKLQNPHLKVCETPITFEKRLAGESKRKLFQFILQYGQSVFWLLCLRFPILQNLFYYGLFGTIALGLDYAVYVISLQFGIIPEISSLLGNAVGFMFTYTMNTFVNFRKKDKKVFRFLSYLVIIIAGSTLSTLLISIGKTYINLFILKFLVLLIISTLQFILNRFITYAK